MAKDHPKLENHGNAEDGDMEDGEIWCRDIKTMEVLLVLSNRPIGTQNIYLVSTHASSSNLSGSKLGIRWNHLYVPKQPFCQRAFKPTPSNLY